MLTDDEVRKTCTPVTSVTIRPTEDEPDLEGFIGFLGRDVRSLVR